jgi:hypothetical protein
VNLRPELLETENYETSEICIESAIGILSESKAEQFEIIANVMKEGINLNLIGGFP